MELKCQAGPDSSFLRSLILGGLVFLFFATPLVFYPWSTYFHMSKETFAQVVLLIIVVFWTIWTLNTKKHFSLRSPLTIPVTALAAAILLSLINTESFYDSALGLALWGSYVLTYFIIISVVDSSRWIKNLLGAVLSAGFLAAFYLILQFYGIDFPFWIKLGGRGRLFSTFGNPNYVAGYLIGCLPIALVWFISVKKRSGKLTTGILVVILYTAVLMTYTRASWVGLLASALFTLMLLFLFVGRRVFRRNRYWLVGLALTLLAITVVYSTPSPLNWEGRSVVGRAASSVDFTQSSLQKRFLIWLSTIEIAKQHPIIGSGIGTFGVHYPEAQGEVLARENNRQFIPWANKSINAHNDILHMWAEIGILGLLAAAWIIIASYGKGLIFLKDADQKDKLFLISFMGGSLAILGHSIFSFPFHVIPNGLLFWLLLALSWVTIGRARVESHEPRPKTQHPILCWAISIVVIGVVIFLGTARVRIFQADLNLKQGMMSIDGGNLSKAVTSLERAVELDPARGEAQSILGMAYAQLGRYYEAIKAFKKAEKNWIYRELYTQLGLVYREVGQIEKAKEAFWENIALFPNYGDPYLNLGVVYALQAERHLSAGKIESAEEELDRALLYYEQAKIFNPTLRLPTRLAESYYELGLKMSKRSSQQQDCPFSFFSEGEEPTVDLLKPIARPDKPIYFKLFFYAPGTNEFPGGELVIENGEGKGIRELPLEGSGSIARALLQEGLAEGEYTARATIQYDGKRTEVEESFAVIGKEKPPIEISELSASKAEHWEPAIIHLIVKNNWNAPIMILVLVELRNAKWQKLGLIQSSPMVIPGGKEKEIELSWDRELPPGMYKATALVIYGEKLIKEEIFFIAPPYLGAGER